MPGRRVEPVRFQQVAKLDGAVIVVAGELDLLDSRSSRRCQRARRDQRRPDGGPCRAGVRCGRGALATRCPPRSAIASCCAPRPRPTSRRASRETSVCRVPPCAECVDPTNMACMSGRGNRWGGHRLNFLPHATHPPARSRRRRLARDRVALAERADRRAVDRPAPRLTRPPRHLVPPHRAHRHLGRPRRLRRRRALRPLDRRADGLHLPSARRLAARHQSRVAHRLPTRAQGATPRSAPKAIASRCVPRSCAITSLGERGRLLRHPDHSAAPSRRHL